MNVLDLFSGIGGFSLGLERAGMRTVAFCECDPYCQRVLRKHWPDVPIFDDVRTLTASRLVADAQCWGWYGLHERKQSGHMAADLGGSSSDGSPRSPAPNYSSEISWEGQKGSSIDLICGGFPCQDISVAGKGAGIKGERSGLWSEFARIIGEVRPRYVIVENVSALLSRGLGRVLGDLAALGFDAEWHCIPASAVGAPHVRDRVWIIAYADRNGERVSAINAEMASLSTAADAASPRWNGAWSFGSTTTNGSRAFCELARSDWWLVEPDVGRVAHGIPARVDRLRSLGNAVVPQIPEIIGRAIMSVEHDEYDGADDFARSIDECYCAIRERKAKGGPGWRGWE
jgi:DNA (cytosine-5)-methyltransferase 1